MAMAVETIHTAIAVTAMMNLVREAPMDPEVPTVRADQDHAATIAPILPEDFLSDSREFSSR